MKAGEWKDYQDYDRRTDDEIIEKKEIERLEREERKRELEEYRMECERENW